MLLLLDNCEHLVADVAQISEGLLKACPELRILATSREGLGIKGERQYHLPPLSLPVDIKVAEAEAVQLFVERARVAQPNFDLNDQNSVAVAQVCTILEGIPLAVELAAARTRIMTVDQIVSRLD